jgi:hypothetical protein
MPRQAETLPPRERRVVCSCQCSPHERTPGLATDTRRVWPSDKQSGPSTGFRSPVRQRASFRWMRPGCHSALVPPTSWLDPQRAAVHSRQAISLYDAATGPGRWPANQALARLDLATALAQLGEPEEASHTALEALAIFSERPVDSVMRRAGDLEAVLDVEPYRQLPAVRQYLEQLQITRAEAGLA